MVHGDPLWCDFIISCTDSFCAHSFYLWWSACQDLTLIIIDPARVRAQCACMHTFLHFISGCEWTPHQSIFTRKLTSRFGGRMRKPIPLNGEIKLCFFFFGWKDDRIHFLEWIVMSWLAKIVSLFFAALLIWRC